MSVNADPYCTRPCAGRKLSAVAQSTATANAVNGGVANSNANSVATGNGVALSNANANAVGPGAVANSRANTVALGNGLAAANSQANAATLGGGLAVANAQANAAALGGGVAVANAAANALAVGECKRGLYLQPVTKVHPAVMQATCFQAGIGRGLAAKTPYNTSHAPVQFYISIGCSLRQSWV